MIIDNVRNMPDQELYFILGMVRTSVESINNFIDDPDERDELIFELYEQYKDVLDEFKRRQRVFDIKPS